MALINTQNVMLFMLTILCSSSELLLVVSALEHEAGDNTGWIVPPSNDTNFFNNWASKKRFRPGDTIRFKYKKDSVMEVIEEDYIGCNSTRPKLFSNTGNSIYTLDRSGYFYFISGASGHCQKGQKMIVKVMALDQEITTGGGGTSSANSITLYDAIIVLIFSVHFAFLYLTSHSF